MSIFCRASEAKFGKMVENKVVATIKIWTEPKFPRNWSNGSKDTTIFVYEVNHACERLHYRAFPLTSAHTSPSKLEFYLLQEGPGISVSRP